MASTEAERSVPTARAAPAPTSTRHIVIIGSLTRSLVNFRLELMKDLLAAGHRVTALAPDDDPPVIAELSRIGIGFRRIPMARTGTNPFADLRTLAGLYRQMRSLRPDVTLAYTMKPIIYGGLAAQLAGVPEFYALFTGFGFLFSGRMEGARAALLRETSLQLYRAALRKCKAAFVYNDADAEDVRRYAMLDPATPLVMVAGSGVDLSLFSAAPPPPGPPAFLMVARLLREKGIAEFAAAARTLKTEFPAARFQLLGPFDPSPLAISRTDLDRWTSEGALEYLGETRDVRPYLAASTVFVLPSYYREGIPRSALEALATGRAVVTTTAPGCRETVIDGVNGFRIAPRDVEALVAAMRRFLEDPGLALRMGAMSRRIAEERFDVRAVNRTLIAAMKLSPAQSGPTICSSTP